MSDTPPDPPHAAIECLDSFVRIAPCDKLPNWLGGALSPAEVNTIAELREAAEAAYRDAESAEARYKAAFNDAARKLAPALKAQMETTRSR